MSASWLNVMVEFARTNGLDQEAATRGEKYRRLRANAQRHRQELEAWIASQGLEAEVQSLGDAMAFDLLFATVTPQAAAALHHAPGVVAVTPAPDVSAGTQAALAHG
jgi:glutamate-1-semialdehyde aminotransferase